LCTISTVFIMSLMGVFVMKFNKEYIICYLLVLFFLIKEIIRSIYRILRTIGRWVELLLFC
jgi:hypothetical protein